MKSRLSGISGSLSKPYSGGEVTHKNKAQNISAQGKSKSNKL